MKRLLIGLAACQSLMMLSGVLAQSRNPHGNALDQGNDSCPATVIYQMPYFDEGSTVGMANDYGSTCGGSGAPDAIYTYTPVETAMHTVSLLGSHYDTVLHVREGGACPGDSQVACNDDYFQLQSALDVQMHAGLTYYFIVDGYSGYAGWYHLFVFPWPECDTESWWHDSAEVSEYPIDSVFYQHDPTGGCSVDPAAFQSMPWWIDQWSYPYGLNGRSFNYYDDSGELRADEDWYTFTVSEPETVTTTVKAGFPVHLEILRLEGECDSISLLAQTTQSECSLTTISRACLDIGEYALRVSCAADTEMLVPQVYRVTVRSRACRCDSVTGVTVFCCPDHRHVWLHWSADIGGQRFWIYSTGDTDASFPDPLWEWRASHMSAEPGLQYWTDPDTSATYQRYVVVRYCP